MKSPHSRSHLRAPKAIADLIPFPGARRVGKARDIAQKLSQKKTERARAYYTQQTLENMVHQLVCVGVNTEVAKHEARAFIALVYLELNQIECGTP